MAKKKSKPETPKSPKKSKKRPMAAMPTTKKMPGC